MLRDERLKRILAALTMEGSRTTSDLAALFSVSEMTLRRDLDDLAARGMIRRVRGGAVAASTDPGIRWRAQENTDEKRRIGRAAAQLVKSGSSIYLDAGTTALEVGRALAERARIERFEARIVTPAVNIGAELAGQAGLTVHQLGGEIEPRTLAATGQAMLSEIDSMNFDMFFMGITGVDRQRGFTNSSPVGVEAKRRALKRARETWVVADSQKWNRISAYEVAPLESATGLVTNTENGGDFLDELARTAIAIHAA